MLERALVIDGPQVKAFFLRFLLVIQYIARLGNGTYSFTWNPNHEEIGKYLVGEKGDKAEG